MILHQYRYRNRKLQCYTNSIETNVEPNVMAITVARQIIKSEDSQDPQVIAYRKDLADCELDYFGTFDDASGEYTLLDKPTLVLVCGDYITNKSAGKENA